MITYLIFSKHKSYKKHGANDDKQEGNITDAMIEAAKIIDCGYCAYIRICEHEKYNFKNSLAAGNYSAKHG